jgi:hypothetical protein
MNGFYALSNQKFYSNCDGSDETKTYGQFELTSLYMRNVISESFSARLGPSAAGQEGKPGMYYEFQRVFPYTASFKGTYSSLMVQECAAFNMKPVCDHPDYCKEDPKAVWIGQASHIAYWPHRNKVEYFPSGWNKRLIAQWNDLCSYTAGAGKTHEQDALCNIPRGGHIWKSPRQVKVGQGFMCGKEEPDFSASLGAMNGVAAGRCIALSQYSNAGCCGILPT